MMDTMAAISDLLTEFNARKQTITNSVDRSALVKDIDCLERAWNSGNAGDAKKYATNVQKFAKKHKNKFTDSFWQMIESISSGNSVPQKTRISSARPTSKYNRRGSETTAASKGSTTKQPVKSKPQNEKESEQERAMEVQGIKFKAQQLQSEKNMAQQLQVIRNRIEELAAAMRPHPNDVKNSNSKSEDCNTLVEIILNQSAELLNVYRQEKASCNRIHVEHATIRQGLKPICDAFINANTEKMETINMIEELGKCLKAKYVRISDTENRLKEMFKNATGREYKGPGNKGGKGKKENQTDTVEVFQQLINDMDRQLVDYTSQQVRIHQDSVKSKEELENLQKRISDTEKMLKDMFQHVTGQKYKESSNKDGKRKQEHHPEPVEILQQSIYDLEKQLVDYISQQDKIHKDNVNPKQELEHLQKRMTDTEKRLREMFLHVTGLEYKGPSISDGKGKTKENQYNTVEELHQMISDMDKHLVDYKRAMEVQGIKYKAQQVQRLSEQVSYENRQYEKLEKEEDELLSRLSEQLIQEKKLFGKIDVEKDEFLNRLSQQLSEEKNKYEQLRNEKKEMHNRLLHQLSHEEKRYIALKTDRDEKHWRLSNQLSDEKSKFRALKTENDDMYQRLSLQLSEEKEKYEQLKKEKEELHNSDGMVSGRKAKDDEQQQCDDMVAGRKPTCDGRQETDDMVAGRKPTCEGRQEIDNDAHNELSLIRRLLKPICAEVLNADTDGMETIQMIECLGQCLKERNGRTQQDTPPHDNQLQQLKYKREAWM